MPLWLAARCFLQASASPRAGCATATLTARTAPMKSLVKPPSASRPSTLVPTTLLCASPPTRSATAKWTARTARTRDPSAVTLATSPLSIHHFASDLLRNAAWLHMRAHFSHVDAHFGSIFYFFVKITHGQLFSCSVAISPPHPTAPLMWLLPSTKVLSDMWKRIFLILLFLFLKKLRLK